MKYWDKKEKTLALFNISIITLFLIIYISLIFSFFRNIPILFLVLTLFIMLTYIFLVFINFYKYIKMSQSLKMEKALNESLTLKYDSVRGFKHDFENIINIISGYIQVNDIDGLKEYFLTLEKECVHVNNTEIINPKTINNPGVYNLIASKYKKAVDLGVHINIEFFFNFNNLNIPIFEFSRILGILLDNSIEAAKDSEEKQINIVFRESKRQHIQIIVIENTYSEKNLDTNKIFKKGISGKKNHSGIGLWEVQQIVNKHNNMILNTTKDEKYFKQELQIDTKIQQKSIR